MKNTSYYDLVPTATGSFGYGWRKMFEKSFLPLLVAVIIVGIIDGPSAAGVNWNIDDGGFSWPMMFLVPFALFAMAYSFLFVPIIKYGENLLFCGAYPGSGRKRGWFPLKSAIPGPAFPQKCSRIFLSRFIPQKNRAKAPV